MGFDAAAVDGRGEMRCRRRRRRRTGVKEVSGLTLWLGQERKRKEGERDFPFLQMN